MVRGLAALVAEVYSGCSPEKVAEFSCTLLEDAGLDRIITPTRLQGLAHLQTAIRQCKFEP
jgi:sulfur transfer protein SufE